MLATLALCALASALVGRWWTLLLPVALIVGVFGAGLSRSLYAQVPEDIQAGIAFGAGFGLILGAVLVLARHHWCGSPGR